MTIRRPTLVHTQAWSLTLILCAGTTAAAQTDDNGAGADAAQPAAVAAPPDERNRRVIEGPPTTLAFKDVTVADIVPFIVEVTGKVVMPQQAVMTRKITILNDQPIPRQQALDLVVLALQQNGIAVVETDKTVTLRDIGEVTRQDVPVIGPAESLLFRTDLGNIVEKVYPLRFNTAKAMSDVVKTTLPDFAKMSVDEESNQISIMGNIGLLQRIEVLVASLDRPAAGALQTETFRLRYADADAIKINVEELFGTANGARARNNENQNRQFRFPGQPSQEGGGASTSEIRVSANKQQNSVTVVADPVVLDQVRTQINDEWDQPLPEEAITPRKYDLKYSDPVKVAALLEGLFGRSTATTGGGGGGGGQGNQNQQQPASSQGVGRLAGQFSFQPIADSGRLIVIAKSPDNAAIIDKIIADIDQPQTAGLPSVIELKHANAEDLAEQLNALLAQEGTLASIRRAESGLTDSTTGASPFAQNQDTAATDQGTAGAEQPLSFWWARARTPTDRRSSSNLIGQLRIVPVWRQNALMVVAPPEYKQSILEMIAALDKPGRQVLISAIVAEVSREDALSLGLRWSSQTLTPSNPDNSISIGSDASGTRNNFATSLFDTSVLNVNTDVNLLLQALAQDTDVSILSEPKIFTSDNQEAEFFDGQDIPFITDSQVNTQGNLVQSFDYRAVGIRLTARPRITVQQDVDLRVNLELSSIVPGQTINNAFIVDRRETTTQLIVKNAQTVVISGILREEATNIIRKVPILGSIPILGELFKSRDITKSNTELLVFITPIVVNNTAEADPANARYIERLQDLKDDFGKDTKKDDPRLRPGQLVVPKAFEPAPDVAPTTGAEVVEPVTIDPHPESP